MKTMRKNNRRTKMHILAGVTAALLAGTASATPFVFTEIGQTYTENFNDYRGSSATLPNHMSTSDDLGTSDSFRGVGDFNNPGVYGNFSAYTSDNEDFSFGIRERSPDSGFRNARLFFEFTNDTGYEITGFNVSYDVEAWYVGDRRNRIRMKYDTDLGSGRFDKDIFSTDNPSTETTANTIVNGSLADNRITVSGFVDLTTLDDGTGNFFGPLADGETAYFRWQFSNLDGGESGSLRSGLAINNLSIQAIPEPMTIGMLGLAAGLAMLWRRWVARS